MSEQSESNGAGWGNRTPVLSLENLYISRYTNPAINNPANYNRLENGNIAI